MKTGAEGGCAYEIDGDAFVIRSADPPSRDPWFVFSKVAMASLVIGLVGDMPFKFFDLFPALVDGIETYRTPLVAGGGIGLPVAFLLDLHRFGYRCWIPRDGTGIVERWRWLGIPTGRRFALRPDDVVRIDGKRQGAVTRCRVLVGREAEFCVATGASLEAARSMAEALAAFAGLRVETHIEQLPSNVHDPAGLGGGEPSGNLPPDLPGAQPCEMLPGGVVHFPPFRPGAETVATKRGYHSGPPFLTGIFLTIAGVVLCMALGALLLVDWWIRYLGYLPWPFLAYGLWRLYGGIVRRWDVRLDPRDQSVTLERLEPFRRTRLRYDAAARQVISLDERGDEDSAGGIPSRVWVGGDTTVPVFESHDPADARKYANALAAAVGFSFRDLWGSMGRAAWDAARDSDDD